MSGMPVIRKYGGDGCEVSCRVFTLLFESNSLISGMENVSCAGSNTWAGFSADIPESPCVVFWTNGINIDMKLIKKNRNNTRPIVINLCRCFKKINNIDIQRIPYLGGIISSNNQIPFNNSEIK